MIEYNPLRLPVCRSNGPLDFPSWGIDVFVKFHPDGKLHQGKVTHSAETELDVELMGWIKPLPFEIEVPEDATFVEIWFNNSDYSNCSTWDSRYGQNYTYPVLFLQRLIYPADCFIVICLPQYQKFQHR